MKRLLCAALLFLVGCATAPKPLTITPPKLEVEPDTRGIVALLTEFGFAHACPVVGRTLTAAHVVRYHTWDYNYGVRNFTWSDGYGNKGVALGLQWHTDRDIGEVQLTGRYPVPYDIGEAEVGEKVWWVDFDRSRDKWGTDKVRTAKVQSIIGGMIVFDEAPMPGASGGCLLNKWGQAVGIVVWALNVEDGSRLGAAFEIPPIR